MAKGILYLCGETIAAVVQENLCTRSVELVLEHSVNAMLLGLEVGAVIPLPLAEATTLNFTAPIWAVILSMLLLKEKIGRYRWSAVAIGFVGILIVTQPGGTPVDPTGIAVGLAAAFMVALISIQIQDLNKTEGSTSIVFWFCLLTAPVAAICVAILSA